GLPRPPFRLRAATSLGLSRVLAPLDPLPPRSRNNEAEPFSRPSSAERLLRAGLQQALRPVRPCLRGALLRSADRRRGVPRGRLRVRRPQPGQSRPVRASRGLALVLQPLRTRRYSSTGAAAERSLISSTTVGSASVVVSPRGRSSATSRRSRRMIFPDRV